MRRFRCLTFGCRVNQYETQAIREQLLARGYEESGAAAPDLVVVNSCTVTESADRECVSALKALHADYPAARIVVTGCLVQRDADSLKLPGVRVLAGTSQKHRIAELLEREDFDGAPLVETELSRVYSPLAIGSFGEHSRAFVKVQDGCDRACAFCKIPLVRGRSRSRPLERVLEEVRRLVAGGYQEIVLAGVALGLWGRELDPATGLAELLAAVDALPGRFRVRLSSLDPRDLDPRFFSALRSSRRLCRHLHLSLQSGSDPVLARMNRGYTSGWYRDSVQEVRRFWPDLGLTTDLIAGFPGETDALFEQTLRFCREMRFAKVHVFPYSRRRGTSASLFRDPVAGPVVKARARRLREAASESAAEFHAGFVGTVQEILIEEGRTGYTSQYLSAELKGDWPARRQLALGRVVEARGCRLHVIPEPHPPQ